MDFGADLKNARLKAGLSQEEMADKIYVSHSTVSRLERGKIELKAKELMRWIQVTQAPELLAVVLCSTGLDLGTITQAVSSITTLIGGFIYYI